MKENIWNTLRKDPLFIIPIEDPSINKQKEIAHRRVKRLNEYAFLTDKELMENPLKRLMFDEALVMIDNDSNVKYSLHCQV